ncbi:hypothetical protein M514_26001 [Trichuris suis]|uniref:Uncharacterized protein n=1 Tax=Trichuris suis TaxID=68888 RepID=A0A085MXA7_9BILA|nr:hypothetical protein M514_26001 [Trichuris suis]
MTYPLVEASPKYVRYRQQVPPRFELGLLDSKSRVLTVTPWNRKDSAWPSEGTMPNSEHTETAGSTENRCNIHLTQRTIWLKSNRLLKRELQRNRNKKSFSKTEAEANEG